MDPQTGSQQRWVSAPIGCESSRKELLGVSVSPSVRQTWGRGAPVLKELEKALQGVDGGSGALWRVEEALRASRRPGKRRLEGGGPGPGLRALPAPVPSPQLSSKLRTAAPPAAQRPGHRRLQDDLVWPVPLPEPRGADLGMEAMGRDARGSEGRVGRGQWPRQGKGTRPRGPGRVSALPGTSREEEGVESVITGHQGAPGPRARGLGWGQLPWSSWRSGRRTREGGTLLPLPPHPQPPCPPGQTLGTVPPPSRKPALRFQAPGRLCFSFPLTMAPEPVPPRLGPPHRVSKESAASVVES